MNIPGVHSRQAGALGLVLASATLSSCRALWGFEELSGVEMDDASAADDSGPDLDAGDEGDTSLIDSSFPPAKRSCAALTSRCGPTGAIDCCESPLVPGGTFKRSFDGIDGGSYTDPQYIAEVSSYRLDMFEVTVGRFRAFVDAYPGSLPAAGAGKNPKNFSDTGWNDAWNATAMPPTREALSAAITCQTHPTATWTAAPGANETKAINCITWFEAFAFCIWDGGRLPSEAEWNFAAAGGSEQRARPWSTPPSSTAIDSTYAVYGNAAAAPVQVGLKSPKGDGRWGHADLAGNVFEWTRDFLRVPYAMTSCSDCADLSPADEWAIRGGSVFTIDVSLFSSFRAGAGKTFKRGYDIGVRCARPL